MSDTEYFKTLKNFGYAPGSYRSVCSSCGRSHTSDKKAWKCFSCAQAKEAESMGLKVVPAVLRGEFETD